MEPSQWDLSINSAGHLAMDCSDLVELARRHGTPLHVVSENKLRSNARGFVSAARRADPRNTVTFSYKTNCVSHLLRKLQEEDCGAEVISPYELWLARQLEVSPDRIVYNGVAKSPEDLRAAVDCGVRLLHVDSALEVEHLIEVATAKRRSIDVGIRVQPPGGWRAQFGIESGDTQLLELARRLQSCPYTRLRSLSAHLGTGLRQPGGHVRAARTLCSLARRLRDTHGVEIDVLDLGGGFGVPTVKTLSLTEVAFYKLLNRPPSPPREVDCPSAVDFVNAIAEATAAESRRAGLEPPALVFEPGRGISSSAQVLLVSVQDIKRRMNGRTYAITDGGMQTIAFPLSYEYHHCFVANRASERPTERYFVAGSLCSPQDLLYRNWPLPKLSQGDVLAIMDAGAYFTSFANSFSFPRAPIAVVRDGESRLIRRRESFEDLRARDIE